MDLSQARIAYLSMEIGISAAIPTYSGGLGLLAGDVARAAADLSAPMVLVTLLYREGYFHQRIDGTQWQQESPVAWSPRNHCTPLGPVASVGIEGREVRIAAWRYDVAPHAKGGRAVPIILLDTDLPENDPHDRAITHALYAGDPRHRVRQEAVLGLGAVRALKALGAHRIQRWHLNEGHAAFAVRELGVRDNADSPCIFTTHTPIAAGHDRFPMWLIRDVLGDAFAGRLAADCPDAVLDDVLNMTLLASWRSRSVIGVSKRHGEVSRTLLGMPRIGSVTNGVHGAFWADHAVAGLLDRHAPGWREDHTRLARAEAIPLDELAAAHADAKRRLIERVNRETNAGLDLHHFTVGFARRATAYKRPELLLARPDHLREIARRVGPLQVVMGGKAHPHDHAGKMLMQRVMREMNGLNPDIRCVYLPN
jgi:starch phosphorylase